MIAIGGGGYVPARTLRYVTSKSHFKASETKNPSTNNLFSSFLKKPNSPNIPIQAIGLSLYEQLGSGPDSEVETPGTKVTRTQWLDLSSLEMANLIGKNRPRAGEGCRDRSQEARPRGREDKLLNLRLAQQG